MDSSNNSWRSQLSFAASMCLHAGAIALIALGPTLANDFHGNNGTEKVELTVTDAAPKVDVTPTPAAVTTPEPAPVVEAQVKPIAEKPIAKKVAIHKKAPVVAAPKVETQDAIQPQPVIEAQNNEAPVENVTEEKTVEEKVEKKQEEKKEEVKPDPVKVSTQEQIADQAEKVAATNTSSSGSPEAVTPTPAGVTQNYLGLRQQAGNKPPVYSRDMRMKQMQGAGQLVYFVGKDGSVSDLKVTKSTGTPELDQAAIDAFSKYKFVPGQEGYTVHNFEFDLKGPAVSDTGRLRTATNR